LTTECRHKFNILTQKVKLRAIFDMHLFSCIMYQNLLLTSVCSFQSNFYVRFFVFNSFCFVEYKSKETVNKNEHKRSPIKRPIKSLSISWIWIFVITIMLTIVINIITKILSTIIMMVIITMAKILNTVSLADALASEN